MMPILKYAELLT